MKKLSYSRYRNPARGETTSGTLTGAWIELAFCLVSRKNTNGAEWDDVAVLADLAFGPVALHFRLRALRRFGG